MKISVSNKKLNAKPKTTQEKAHYFKDLKFTTGNFSLNSVKEIIENGYTITYLYKDDMFDRTNSYMVNNYLGTQYICVDVDACDIPPSEFIMKIKNKPTITHTTFSNLTERKDYKYCYHLLYFFDQIIYGEDKFSIVFNSLTDDYKEYVDKNARDCHRAIFTSNPSLDKYEYYESGIIYTTNDFLKEEYDDLNSFFNKSNEEDKWDKNKLRDISYTSLHNISEEAILSQDNSFNLEEQFIKDMYSMKRSEFIDKYSNVYPYVTQTQIDPQRYKDGYADLRNEEYYILPTSKYRWDADRQKACIPEVSKGRRNLMLWLDALYFQKIIPDITKEQLVYLLTCEAYFHFDNSDKELTNRYIIEKCSEAWEKKNRHVAPTKKTFKLDKDYWAAQGITDNWISVCNHVRRQMKYEEFGSLYDCSLTMEQNIKEFKKHGIKTTPKTLIQWLQDNGITYRTDKAVRDEYVIKLYNEDPQRSSRVIAKMCNNEGISVNYRTIQRILKEHKSKP